MPTEHTRFSSFVLLFDKAKKSILKVFSMVMKYGRIRILVALAVTGENIANASSLEVEVSNERAQDVEEHTARHLL